MPANAVAIYVSEPMVDLYGANAGSYFNRLSDIFAKPIQGALPGSAPATFFVAGVWRDYARQFGAIAMALKAGASDYMMKPFDRDILEKMFLVQQLRATA